MAVGAADVGSHDAVLDAGAVEQLQVSAIVRDGGHDMARRLAGADGDVAVAVSVHDEHVRIVHARTGSEANPGVTVRCADLEIDVSGAGTGRGLGDGDLEADIVGAVGAVRCWVC